MHSWVTASHPGIGRASRYAPTAHQHGYKGLGPMGRSQNESILQLPAWEVVDHRGETRCKCMKPEAGPWQWTVYSEWDV